MSVKVTGTNNNDENLLIKLVTMITGENKDIVKIFPYKRIENGILIDRNDKYQAYLKVKTSDLYSINDSERSRLISTLTTIAKVYTDPFKILSTTYPTATLEQQQYFSRKINQYRTKLINENLTDRQKFEYENKRKLAIDNLRKLQWVENELKELAFFIVLYGDSKKQVTEKIRHMQRLGKRDFELTHIVDRESLLNIINRLTNMNLDY